MDSLEKLPAGTAPTIVVASDQSSAAISPEEAIRIFASFVMLNGIANPGTRAIYQTCLFQFFDWMVTQPHATFCRADVRTYLTHLQEQGKAASTRNNAIAAIKRLAKEAYFAGKLSHEAYFGIADVKGSKKRTIRPGNWLTLRQVNELLSLPNIATMKGLRDRALLGVLIGCALRRQEICDLTVNSIEQRSGRWVFIVRGKGDKIRIVGIAPGLKVSIDEWTGSRECDDLLRDSDTEVKKRQIISTLPLFCVIKRGGHPIHRKLDTQSIEDILRSYSTKLNPPLPKLAPHDLRRTHARLAREAGADLEQIQFALGHDSVVTTQIYLGNNQRLDRTPGDVLDVDWQGGKG